MLRHVAVLCDPGNKLIPALVKNIQVKTRRHYTYQVLQYDTIDSTASGYVYRAYWQRHNISAPRHLYVPRANALRRTAAHELVLKGRGYVYVYTMLAHDTGIIPVAKLLPTPPSVPPPRRRGPGRARTPSGRRPSSRCSRRTPVARRTYNGDGAGIPATIVIFRQKKLRKKKQTSKQTKRRTSSSANIRKKEYDETPHTLFSLERGDGGGGGGAYSFVACLGLLTIRGTLKSGKNKDARECLFVFCPVITTLRVVFHSLLSGGVIYFFSGGRPRLSCKTPKKKRPKLTLTHLYAKLLALRVILRSCALRASHIARIDGCVFNFSFFPPRT